MSPAPCSRESAPNKTKREESSAVPLRAVYYSMKDLCAAAARIKELRRLCLHTIGVWNHSASRAYRPDTLHVRSLGPQYRPANECRVLNCLSFVHILI